MNDTDCSSNMGDRDNDMIIVTGKNKDNNCDYYHFLLYTFKI